MADTNFEAGQGTAEQLPQGAASTVNETTNVEAPAPLDTSSPDPGSAIPPTTGDGQAEGSVPTPDPSADLPDFASPADFEPLYDPQSDEEAFIVGPTTRPDEAVTVGANPTQPLPARVRRALPGLQKLAAEPTASPEFVSLINLLIREGGR